jgi:cytochrome c oxidase subunit 4
MSDNKGHHQQSKHHHIVPVETCKKIFYALLFLTVVTVAAAQVHLGPLNFTIAMLIATVKALAVVLYFMGLKDDSNENRTIFFSSFFFVGIFIVLTFSDIMFRGDVYVKKPIEDKKVTSVEHE